MDKVKAYLKHNWLKLIYLLLVLVVLCLVMYGVVMHGRKVRTVYVLPTVPTKPDSVRSKPNKAEKSALGRWDSLKNIHP